MDTLVPFTVTPEYWRAAPDGLLVPGVCYMGVPERVQELQNGEARHGARIIDRESDVVRAAPAPRLWQGEDLDGKRVAFYSHGRFGDCLTHTALVREIGLRYPGADITVIAEASHDAIWYGNLHCGGAIRGLAPFWTAEAAGTFDYWIIPGMVGLFNRGTSANIYDLLAADIGLPSIAVPRPYVTLTEELRQGMRAAVPRACWNHPNKLPPDFWERLVVVQLNSMEEERTPPERFQLLRTIAQAVAACAGDGEPYHIAVYGDGWAMRDVITGVFAGTGSRPTVGGPQWQESLPNTYLFIQEANTLGLTLRALLILTEAARAVICPDSFGLHAAAAWDVPTLALWNLEPGARNKDGDLIPPPESRIATYDNVTVASMVPGGIRDRAIQSFIVDTLGSIS